MGFRVVKLPDVGEGVAEAEVVEWRVANGDLVVEDQVLAAVMTDKATVEIPSPVSGTVIECGAEVGTILAVGAKLVTIELAQATGGESPIALLNEAARSAPETPRQPAGSVSPSGPALDGEDAHAIVPPAGPSPAIASTTLASRGGDLAGKPLASPSVRRRARELGVDLRQVAGDGPAGRITHENLDAFRAPVPGRAARHSPHRSGIEEIKVGGLRRKIAERMAEATRRIAHFSYIEEVDVTELEELRAHLNARFAGSRPKLTVLPFIVRALTVAIEEFPQLNALYDDEREVVMRHAGVHAGIATQTRSGLMVPVMRHAETHDLWGCAAEIKRLADAARDGSAKREELSGSTISISSLGDLGGVATTPVINRPEVAIVGVNKIAVRPAWRDNQFAPRKMMNLSSSFDHRVIDGQEAAMFIRRIKDLLEKPAAMFIEG
jgi:2-oxoisovalerate dehydrogenase E2 component (dihydrolipoyl transacylase)